MKMRRERSEQLAYKWWITSTACPLFAAVIGPIGCMFIICSLSADWTQCFNATDMSITSTSDPSWITAVKASATAVAILATLFLVLLMVRRMHFKVAVLAAAVGWLASCILLSIAIDRRESMTSCPGEHTRRVPGQAYYYGIFACALFGAGSIALFVALLGAYRGHYKHEFKLTAPQRTLIIQVMVLTAYYLLSALVFSYVESWSFLDTFYWVDVTLLTIGLGHAFVPQTPLGRGLLLPFAVIGISFVGLVIGSTRTLALKRARVRFKSALIRARLKKLAEIRRKRRNSIRLGFFHRLDLRDHELDFHASGEREFNIMRHLISATETDARTVTLGISAAAFLSLWLAGSTVFMTSEGWSFFDGWYFSYVAFMTIGYGDFAPTTAFGRVFFVLWTMLAVPALTMLISNAGEMLVSVFKSIAKLLGKSTGRLDNETPPGIPPNRTLADRGHSNGAVVPPAENLAAMAETQSRQEDHQARRRGRAHSQERHIYASQLAWETSRLILDAQNRRGKKYSFKEWTHFLHALGRNENLPLMETNTSGHREGANGAYSHRASLGPEIREEYGWLSEFSPLMASSEPEWLLEKFSRAFAETI